MSTKRVQTFENAMAELEKIVKELENGEIGLDKSVALYTQGKDLYNYCHNIIETTKLKIETMDNEIK